MSLSLSLCLFLCAYICLRWLSNCRAHTLTREKNVNHKNVNRTRTQGADAVHANGDAKAAQIPSTQVKVAVP